MGIVCRICFLPEAGIREIWHAKEACRGSVSCRSGGSAGVRYDTEAVEMPRFGIMRKCWNAVTGIMREQQKMLQIRKRRGGRWQERFGL